MSENIDDYLKDGETPLDAIKRERRSTDNLLRHLADAKQRIEELVQQCEKLRAERNAVRVKVEQPLLLRIRELESLLRQAEEALTFDWSGEPYNSRPLIDRIRKALEPTR